MSYLFVATLIASTGEKAFNVLEDFERWNVRKKAKTNNHQKSSLSLFDIKSLRLASHSYYEKLDWNISRDPAVLSICLLFFQSEKFVCLIKEGISVVAFNSVNL